ncbi:10902_t:CDS:2, partial [Funneliformis caledonium]
LVPKLPLLELFQTINVIYLKLTQLSSALTRSIMLLSLPVCDLKLLHVKINAGMSCIYLFANKGEGQVFYNFNASLMIKSKNRVKRIVKVKTQKSPYIPDLVNTISEASTTNT